MRRVEKGAPGLVRGVAIPRVGRVGVCVNRGGDDGVVADKKGGGEVEGPFVEVPLPTPRHARCFTLYRMAKKNIVGVSLILK